MHSRILSEVLAIKAFVIFFFISPPPIFNWHLLVVVPVLMALDEEKVHRQLLKGAIFLILCISNSLPADVVRGRVWYCWRMYTEY